MGLLEPAPSGRHTTPSVQLLHCLFVFWGEGAMVLEGILFLKVSSQRHLEPRLPSTCDYAAMVSVLRCAAVGIPREGSCGGPSRDPGVSPLTCLSSTAPRRPHRPPAFLCPPPPWCEGQGAAWPLGQGCLNRQAVLGFGRKESLGRQRFPRAGWTLTPSAPRPGLAERRGLAAALAPETALRDPGVAGDVTPAGP